MFFGYILLYLIFNNKVIKDNKINYPVIDKRFLKNSMLLGIDEFSNPNNIFSSRILFNDKNINYNKEDLLRRNWKEICYIYEDYDLLDVHFELKAVGLEKNVIIIVLL